MPTTATAPVPSISMQGIAVPQSSVNAQQFFALTRRLTFNETTRAFAGLGLTDTMSILQTGIISGLSIKFSGTLTVNLAAGTAATTMRWPYDLIRAVRFAANGQSNLINCSGAKLKYRDLLARGVTTDRGVQPMGNVGGITAVGQGGASPGTALQQGSMSLGSEVWGVGSNVTAIVGAPTVYPVELNWYVPIAFDEMTLTGAIFAQTSATDLTLAIDWAPPADLFVLTGAATAVLAGTLTVSGRSFSIPEVNGQIIVPDLSTFHSLIQTRWTTLGNGDNEVRLSGQGVGRQLLRVFAQVWNGAAPTPVPLAVNATNFGQMAWRFGGNDTPETLPDGRHLRYFNERLAGSDVGGTWGLFLWDFAKEFAFRDSIDEGTATELRLLLNIPAAVSLTTPFLEYVQETVFQGATGA
ncbi:MAG TPA: hypothetical protein VKQ71_17620 [Acidimicrobiales bacterium]|nr:hypothetical protein [Acidimicrobiales bacterium]